jgi:PAS domain S-box-containing protein
MTPILARQLRRLALDDASAPDTKKWQTVLDRVQRSYQEAENNRYLMERSLRISSDEMQRLYEDLREASESKLATERDRLRTAIDSLAEGLCLLDESGRIVLMNRSGASICDLEESLLVDSVASKTFILIKGDRDDDAQMPGLDSAVRDGVPIVAQTGWCRTGEDSSVPVSLTLVTVHRGAEVAGAVLVFSDLRERIRARRALEESEDRYRHLFDLSPIASWEVDVSRVILLFENAQKVAQSISNGT